MTMNRQSFALNIGIVILLFHTILAFILWFVVEFPGGRVAVKEITLPVTVSYAVSVLKYFLDTGGRVTATEEIGIRLVVVIVILMGIFMISLVGAPFVYLSNAMISPETLNSFFLFVESAFGALIALIFSYLYKHEGP